MATRSADAPRFLIRFSAGVKSWRRRPAHAARRTDLVNNVFIRLTAVLATLAHPGTAFANPGIAPIAATAPA
jgi:hypothetical protein